MKYQADVNVADFYDVERTWRERLFTSPWRPWQKYSRIRQSMVYVVMLEDGELLALVSPVTFKQLKEQGLEEIEWNG